MLQSSNVNIAYRVPPRSTIHVGLSELFQIKHFRSIIEDNSLGSNGFGGHERVLSIEKTDIRRRAQPHYIGLLKPIQLIWSFFLDQRYGCCARQESVSPRQWVQTDNGSAPPRRAKVTVMRLRSTYVNLDASLNFSLTFVYRKRRPLRRNLRKARTIKTSI